MSKRIYRSQPLITKQLLASFEKLVIESLAKVTKVMTRRFSAKAGGYILGYVHKLIQEKDNVKEQTNS